MLAMLVIAGGHGEESEWSLDNSITIAIAIAIAVLIIAN